MNWKPHTELPACRPQSMLIACTIDGGEPFLLPYLYIWNGVKFISEETGKPIRPAEFWWMPESEVLEGLPA